MNKIVKYQLNYYENLIKDTYKFINACGQNFNTPLSILPIYFHVSSTFISLCILFSYNIYT